MLIDVGQLLTEILQSTRAVVWNWESRNGKTTKVPYVPHRPTDRSSVDDSSTWGSFADVLVAVEDGKADGVGIVLGVGLIGIDLDECCNSETGEIDDNALQIVRELDSYTEFSPSRRGLHILARGTVPASKRTCRRRRA